jgi:hypothetical protein
VFLGLVLADSSKHAFHAGLMVVLLKRAVGRDVLTGVGRTAVASAAAATAMGAVVAVLGHYLAGWLGQGTLGWLIHAAVGAIAGLGAYMALARLLGVGEIDWLLGVVRQRLGDA